MVIQVLLRDLRSGSEQRYEFDQSPVRIGRNPLNNVVLEENFVSGWHGIIRFDDSGTYYFDLGSTNGTCLDGKKLPKNTPIAMTEATRLTILMFELVITPGVPGGAAQTRPQPIPAGAMTSTSRSTEVFQIGALMQPPVHSPTSTSRIVTVGTRTPTPPPPTAASPRPPSQPPASSPTGEIASQRLVRCLRIIGAFSEAFIGLKKGYEQFGAEVGVRPLSGTTRLHRARTTQEIIEYLLDPAVDPDACARDLNAVFADMGIHDVALMEGISQSVHGLLAKLDPNSLDLKASSGLWSGGKAKAKWTSYIETFNNLLAEDTALHAEIFGEEFASAYASVALGGAEAEPDETE